MKNTLKITLIGLLSLGQNSFGQVKSATKAYNHLNFQKSIEIYEGKIANEKFKVVDYKNLANAYFNNADYKKAAKYYEKYISDNPTTDAQTKFKYAQSLKSIENYKKSNEILASLPADYSKIYSTQKTYLEDIKEVSGQYKLHLLEFNTEGSDFSTGTYNDKLIFASAQQRSSLSKNIHSWTGAYFLDLYEVKKTDDNFSKPNRLGKKVNSKFHESSAVLTKDGLTMYFTRNNVVKNKALVNENGVTLLKMFKATRNSVDQDWNSIQELPFNSNEYSVAHPALNSDETVLYFASDMPGGKGESDIYKVNITSGGFGNPKNLEAINTMGRETFPFISKDNILFFASDGHLGLGGLDVFQHQMGSNKVSNIGEPINTTQDDFAFTLSRDEKSGYLSSNRLGGKGSDDIYSFDVLKPKHVCNHELLVIVEDAINGERIANANIDFTGLVGNVDSKYISNAKGELKFPLSCVADLHLTGSKEGYESGYGDIQIKKNSVGVSQVVLKLRTKEIVENKGVFLININPIYFDFDKSNIRPDAALELDHIVEVMNKYPNLIIESGSHTDSRGSDIYNEKLSSRRAKSTLKYIISKGISESRITGKGYGEYQLTNTCSNGVRCSKEAHQLNRRTEFKITNPEVIK